jgi:hypothetical protein
MIDPKSWEAFDQGYKLGLAHYAHNQAQKKASLEAVLGGESWLQSKRLTPLFDGYDRGWEAAEEKDKYKSHLDEDELGVIPNEDELQPCSICGHDGWGNNAEPVNSGICCNKCNWSVVIPARLGQPDDKRLSAYLLGVNAGLEACQDYLADVKSGVQINLPEVQADFLKTFAQAMAGMERRESL